MKAIILKDFGSADNLVAAELPVPAIADEEVLVEIKAISINPVDVKTRIGKGQAAKLKEFNPMILGWDIAGVVKESKSLQFKTGDAVFGMVNFPGHGKAYAQYVAVPAAHLSLKPTGISYEEAAAATLAALTAWQGLVHHGQLKRGDKILVHAAAGGVGHYAVQIAKYLGAYVIGTASADNRDFVLGLGADEHIDYKAVKFEEVLSDIDFVLDTIGGDNIDRSLKVMKPGGTILCLPSGLNESVVEKAAAAGMMGIRYHVVSNGQDESQLAVLLQDKQIRSHVSQVFALEDIAKAHQQQETGRVRGKLVITV